MRALFKDTDLKVLKSVMDVNFWGTVYCTKYAMPEILKTQGSIVGVSSIAGYKGLPGRSGYSASKFAMNGGLVMGRDPDLNASSSTWDCDRPLSIRWIDIRTMTATMNPETVGGPRKPNRQITAVFRALGDDLQPFNISFGFSKSNRLGPRRTERSATALRIAALCARGREHGCGFLRMPPMALTLSRRKSGYQARRL